MYAQKCSCMFVTSSALRIGNKFYVHVVYNWTYSYTRSVVGAFNLNILVNKITAFT